MCVGIKYYLKVPTFLESIVVYLMVVVVSRGRTLFWICSEILFQEKVNYRTIIQQAKLKVIEIKKKA